jgi:selenium metabolism protein YedF
MPPQQTVDARGLACPQPVLETRRVVEEGLAGQFTVLVDNDAAKENVSRYARNQGCDVSVRQDGTHYEISITRPETQIKPAIQEEMLPCPVPESSVPARNVVFVGNNCLGRGDDELGRKLMRGFLRTIIDVPPLPWRMVFINGGVKLTTEDDEAVEAASVLAERGVEVLSCGTCLQHFGLTEKLRIGRVTNMFEVIETLNQASKVISPD